MSNFTSLESRLKLPGLAPPLISSPPFTVPSTHITLEMAFQAMMGGSECSTSNNPLNSLLKQQQTDHSLHHQPSTFNNPHNATTMRSMTPNLGQLNSQEAEQFFQQQQQQGMGMGMEGMRRELENVANNNAIKGDRGTLISYSFPQHEFKRLISWLLTCTIINRMVFAIFPCDFQPLSTRDG